MATTQTIELVPAGPDALSTLEGLAAAVAAPTFAVPVILIALGTSLVMTRDVFRAAAGTSLVIAAIAVALLAAKLSALALVLVLPIVVLIFLQGVHWASSRAAEFRWLLSEASGLQRGELAKGLSRYCVGVAVLGISFYWSAAAVLVDMGQGWSEHGAMRLVEIVWTSLVQFVGYLLVCLSVPALGRGVLGIVRSVHVHQRHRLS